MGEQPGAGDTETVRGGTRRVRRAGRPPPGCSSGADLEEGNGEEDSGPSVKGKGWLFHKEHETSGVWIPSPDPRAEGGGAEENSSQTLNEVTAKRKKSVSPSALPDT